MHVKAFDEKSHPDTAVTNRAVHLFNDNVMSHFRKNSAKKAKATDTAYDFFSYFKATEK